MTEEKSVVRVYLVRSKIIIACKTDVEEAKKCAGRYGRRYIVYCRTPLIVLLNAGKDRVDGSDNKVWTKYTRNADGRILQQLALMGCSIFVT